MMVVQVELVNCKVKKEVKDLFFSFFSIMKGKKRKTMCATLSFFVVLLISDSDGC